jgi:hypothetical protein
MKNIFFKAFFAIAVMLVATACDESFADGSSQDVCQVNVTVVAPDDLGDATVLNETYSFKNIATNRTTQFLSSDNISLIAGLYDVSYEAEVELAGGAHSTMRATLSSVNITNAVTNLTLEAYNNIENDDLIIVEVFFSGTLQSSGNQYYGDDYVKLYNNSDHVIYADGLTFFESKFTTTQKYEHTPDIMSEAMNVQALYTIPGSGTDHPVAPGEYLILADTGIDHRVANPNSFDLSNADFEWYDISTSPTNLDIDGPTVENLDKWYCYTLSFFILHNRGFKAYGIARIPVDKETYLTDYRYDYDYTLVTVAGTFPMSASAYKIPNDWIVDVVTCSVASDYAWNVCAPSLDCGWTHCGSIDKDKDRYFHSVRRKLLRIRDNGIPEFKDTNNSTEDFNPDCIASEIEIQGTAINYLGDKATTLTYDGVVPINQ